MADIRMNSPQSPNTSAPRRRFPAMAQRIRGALSRIEVVALFPLVALCATYLGFDNLALVTAVCLSLLLAIGGLAPPLAEVHIGNARTAISERSALVAMLDRVSHLAGRDTACILLQLDDWAALPDRWGHDTAEDIAHRVEERLQTAMRHGDLLTRLGDSRFGIVLSPLPSARLGLRDTIAARLASAVSEPLPLRGTTIRMTVSIGHCAMIPHAVDAAEATFKAAEAALGEATLNGPSAIRAYAPGMGRARAVQSSLSEDVEAAIYDGAITAAFQPQIHASTGALSGIEVLARWQHPKHGLLDPQEFFPAVEAAGHMPLLGQTILHQALNALQDWDTMGVHIPMVSLKFSAPQLRDPNLAATLAKEVERYGLAPKRIVIEILENVATQVDDDAIVATLQALRDAGHGLDLEGFGLGAASLPTLQRFGVTRVKIDRSFVKDVDVDQAKRQTVSAIVSMAKAMGMKTLANGVETPHEQDALTALHCDFLQGFCVARPMDLDAVADWARAHSASGNTILLEDHRA